MPDDHIKCNHCGKSAYPLLDWRQFANGTWHIEGTCHACERFLKWFPQVPPWTDAIGPHP